MTAYREKHILNIRTGGASMSKKVGEYTNADEIKRTTLCSDLEAAIKAEELREKMYLSYGKINIGIKRQLKNYAELILIDDCVKDKDWLWD